jgi:hypothetical protein
MVDGVVVANRLSGARAHTTRAKLLAVVSDEAAA